MQIINGIAFPNIDVSSSTNIQKSEVVANNGFQLDHLNSALKYVTNWEVAFDGGANIGTWTNVLAQLFDQVYSVEMAPDTFECLQYNVEHWEHTNVITMHNAISNVHTSVGISEGERINARSGGRHIKGEGDIETLIIDDLNIQTLGFLKLDVEGHEAKALLGAIETIKRCRPVILFENKNKLKQRYGNEDPIKIVEELGAILVEKVGKHKHDWIFVWE